MIQSFKHKALRRLFERDDRSGLAAEHVEKIRLILLALHGADEIEAMNLPTFRLHPLKADLRGHWSVTIRANWRIVFRFENGHALDVDLTDYH